MAKLIINPTSSSKREVFLARTVVSIGRDPSNDVVLPDAMVSRRHAVIEYRASQYYIRDCNSSNGSLVNGDRVSERSLRDGDLVAIGTARLLFRDDLVLEDAGGKVVQHPSAPKLQCPQCHADYRKSDLFCRQCGAPVAPPREPPRAVCTSCGTAVPLPARFCNACGSPLARDPEGGAEPPPAPLEPGEVTAAPEARDGSPPAVHAAEGQARLEPPSQEPPTEAPPVEEAPSARPPSEEPPVAVAPRPAEVPRGSWSGAAAEASVLPEPPEPVRPNPSPPLVTSAPAAAPAASAAPPRPWPHSRSPRPDKAPERRDVRAAPPSPPQADLGSRFLAGLIDSVIVSLGIGVLLSPAAWYWWARELPVNPSEVPFLPIMLSLLLVPLAGGLAALYYVYYWGTKGATPGKAMMGLSVQAADGTEPIGVSRAGVRFLGYLLSGALLGIGFIMIAVGGSGLHDRIAGTRVVRSGRD